LNAFACQVVIAGSAPVWRTMCERHVYVVRVYVVRVAIFIAANEFCTVPHRKQQP